MYIYICTAVVLINILLLSQYLRCLYQCRSMPNSDCGAIIQYTRALSTVDVFWLHTIYRNARQTIVYTNTAGRSMLGIHILIPVQSYVYEIRDWNLRAVGRLPGEIA